MTTFNVRRKLLRTPTRCVSWVPYFSALLSGRHSVDTEERGYITLTDFTPEAFVGALTFICYGYIPLERGRLPRHYTTKQLKEVLDFLGVDARRRVRVQSVPDGGEIRRPAAFGNYSVCGQGIGGYAPQIGDEGYVVESLAGSGLFKGEGSSVVAVEMDGQIPPHELYANRIHASGTLKHVVFLNEKHLQTLLLKEEEHPAESPWFDFQDWSRRQKAACPAHFR
eukprot:TRINITY_DN15674_c0_g1_i1.p1 TRINITY_DN15674_c0_g1~~TRINITY_DN15674_c0_g1_i1.p1  ORF type:complete len:224 (-),score=12.27 TRINITY_DN15674_c0_g1_i1:123-794(-)